MSPNATPIHDDKQDRALWLARVRAAHVASGSPFPCLSEKRESLSVTKWLLLLARIEFGKLVRLSKDAGSQCQAAWRTAFKPMTPSFATTSVYPYKGIGFWM